MSVTFNDICNLLESVEEVAIQHPRLKADREKDCIQQIITNWFRQHRQALDDPKTNGCAILSALFPHRRKDLVYSLQPRSLSKKLVTLLNFNHGQRALFERWADGRHGDLGAYTAKAMKPWDGTFKVKPTISISRIEALLVQLASKCRFSDPATQRQRLEHFQTDTELKNVISKLASWEAKWLVRLILRDHGTIDLHEAFILAKYHFLLPDLLMFQNDFGAAMSMLRGELSCYPAVPEPSKESSMRFEAAKRLKARVGIKVGRPTFYKAWSFNNGFQMTGNRAWAAEVKYDGEYCEIHINLDAPNEIQIFSKNGKDATADRQALHQSIRDALRIGQPGCMITTNCIVLGELVLYSDKEDDILPFAKIRKHISRSGSSIGTMEDSLPHDWEHLMIVFFDVLVLNDEPIMRSCLQRRQDVLRQLVQKLPGRAMRSEWTLIDFKAKDGVLDLKQKFAESIARRQEGLVLKPLHSPYFPLISKIGHHSPGYFIKMKKDYLADMGGERDLGDFAIVGARLDAQVAPKLTIKPLHWTHFYLGCLANSAETRKFGSKPVFKIVGTISVGKCIPKQDAKWLNENGRLCELDMQQMDAFRDFGVKRSKGHGPSMTVAFKKPFVVEILGGGYDKVQNESFEMLRHPRVRKVHHDRTWEDAVTMKDLERMAAEKWHVPLADKLDRHARDVAVLVKKYREQISTRRDQRSQEHTTQETSQRTSPRTTQETPPRSEQLTPDDAVVQETQQPEQGTWTTTSTTDFSSSTQGVGTKASRQIRLLVRQDTVEKPACPSPQPLMSVAALPTPPKSSGQGPPSTGDKRRIAIVVSPPPSKRRKLRSPLKDADNKRNLGAFEYDSQERTIHIYAEAGWKVQRVPNVLPHHRLSMVDGPHRPLMDAETTQSSGLATSRHATPELEAPPASSSANSPAQAARHPALSATGSGLASPKHATSSPGPDPPAGRDTPAPPPVQKRGRGQAKYNEPAAKTKQPTGGRFEALPDNKEKADRFLAVVTPEHERGRLQWSSRFKSRKARGGRGAGQPQSAYSYGRDTADWEGGCGSEGIPKNPAYRPTVRYAVENGERVRAETDPACPAPVQAKASVDGNAVTFGAAGDGNVGYCACGMKFFLGKDNENFVQNHLDRCQGSNGCLSPVYPNPGKTLGNTAQKAIDKAALNDANATGGRGGYQKREHQKRRGREGAPSPPDNGTPGGGVKAKASVVHITRMHPSTYQDEAVPDSSAEIKLSAAQLQDIIGAAVSSALEASKSNQQQISDVTLSDPVAGPYARSPFSVGHNGPFGSHLGNFPPFDASSPFTTPQDMPPNNMYDISGVSSSYSFYGIPPTQAPPTLMNGKVPQITPSYSGSWQSRNSEHAQRLANPLPRFDYAGVSRGPNMPMQDRIALYIQDLRGRKPQSL
ncbi:hypothetical protein K491DRAFT_681857 [Lophiostoma macrostomum CBS 122681]|uniref:ATP-dependent DNA ligase family profile domain-containing protein n=1 Tax=Lophiostoma macrostomum CBS 122681 TaxID=1314788 RepID=A0A6A6SVY3_9PLEO|nr:hypothetical protein K491DRAFT_681857 [Lophiostoma macrostomum CBS 122681]